MYYIEEIYIRVNNIKIIFIVHVYCQPKSIFESNFGLNLGTREIGTFNSRV